MENESDLETVEIQRFQCRHIFTDGHRCGSPALRAENFCYFHHTTRKASDPWELHARRAHGKALTITMPEDRAALLLSIGQVLQGLATRTIDRKDAGLMLYGLQVANSALPREPHTAPGPARANSRTQPRSSTRNQQTQLPVEDIIYDEQLGIIAPPAAFLEPEEEKEQKSLARQLLEVVDEHEERQQYELLQQQANREEREAAVRAARDEAREQATAEAYANLEELTAAVRAAAIAETEARLRAEFNQPQPETLPTLQAAHADLNDYKNPECFDSSDLQTQPRFVERASRTRRGPRMRNPLCVGRQRRADTGERRADLCPQPFDRRHRAQTHQGRDQSVLNQVLSGFVTDKSPGYLDIGRFGNNMHASTHPNVLDWLATRNVLVAADVLSTQS